MNEVNCREHGKQRIGLVCTHIAHAIDGGGSVGFFWNDDDTALGRPDAWCWACEQALRVIPVEESTANWFKKCDYKILCTACWDLAKQRLYRSKPSTPS